MHLVWKLSKPGDCVGRWPEMACRRWRQVDAECDTDRPVHPSLEVARVLDVSEETVDNHLDRELLCRHSVDGNIQWFAEAHGATRYMPETLARSGLAPGEQDPVRRDDDGLHGEPGHLGVDPLELGLRQRGTGHNRQSRDSRAARRPRQSARPTVQAPGGAMTAAPHLWTPWGSNGRCIG